MESNDNLRLISTMTCKECLGRATLTAWLPPQGYDPALREYKCPDCGVTYYKRGVFYKSVPTSLL